VPSHVWQDIQQANQRKEAHRENAARNATFTAVYETTGSGDLVPAQAVKFEMPFFSEPSMLSGATLVRLPDRRFYRLPQVTAAVLRWERNTRGFYIGAFMYYRVWCEQLPAALLAPDLERPLPVINHHLSFNGAAYKAMSREVNEAAFDDALRPLTPPTR
jgi:hypothetical protein